MLSFDIGNYDLKSEEDLAVNAAAVLKKREGRTIKSGGLWVYDNEIAGFRGDFEDGDIIAVEDFDGYFMGYGFVNRRSKITIRLLSRRREQPVTPAFLTMRVRAAWEYRKKVIDTSSCRVLFGEADFLPGLTVDKYEDILVAESLALGIDRLKGIILAALVQVLSEDEGKLSHHPRVIQFISGARDAFRHHGRVQKAAEIRGLRLKCLHQMLIRGAELSADDASASGDPEPDTHFLDLVGIVDVHFRIAVRGAPPTADNPRSRTRMTGPPGDPGVRSPASGATR